MLKTILIFLIIFSILVVFHEFGHYSVARRSGILVREFSIGFGPKMVSWRRHHTTFTIRWLPVGGYVRMAGAEDDDSAIEPGTSGTVQLNEAGVVTVIDISEESGNLSGIPLQIGKADLIDALTISGNENADPDQPRTYQVDHDALIIEKDGTEVQIAPRDVQFQSASVGRRIMTNFAGPFNNFLLAIVGFMVVAFLQGGVVSNSNAVGTIQSGSVAAKAGLMAGDQITKVNGQTTSDWTALVTAIQKRYGKTTTLTYQRDGATKTTTLTPKTVQDSGSKTKYGQIGITNAIDRSFGAKLKYGFTATWDLGGRILHVLGSFFTGGFSLNKLSGPVGIYNSTAQVVNAGLVNIVYFLAMLSVNLGLVNLVPIPGLDGGKILLNLVEAIRRKPIPVEKEGIITLIGAGFLLVLMVAVTWNDIVRYFIK
ncbi:RIP metalloprotease RseP [Lapidilactobacillus luobeiensis]|uniref:RIP metalloprotease RseP n=1 Tax=Lapidilactobacillus luobeiensis TaxID=2950371 RepID=UPI0021C3CC20|nr:RIP metalloprotease RseP [Lapidilactobacillus luobeiensis]